MIYKKWDVIVHKSILFITEFHKNTPPELKKPSSWLNGCRRNKRQYAGLRPEYRNRPPTADDRPDQNKCPIKYLCPCLPAKCMFIIITSETACRGALPASYHRILRKESETSERHISRQYRKGQSASGFHHIRSAHKAKNQLS